MQRRFPVVAVESSAASVDELCELLFEWGASGVEQRDADTHPAGLPRLPLEPGAGDELPELRVDFGEVETAGGQLRSLSGRAQAARPVLPGPESGVTLLACFETDWQAEQARAMVAQRYPELPCRLVELRGDEWRHRFRRALAPFRLTSTITVVPPWASPPKQRRDGERFLCLDPGRAFGTGLHATTALCAAILEDRAAELSGREVLDVGTGSGVLGLAALLLGAASVVAIDNDADAVSAARANVELNGLARRMTTETTAVDELTLSFPWVLANIEARILGALAPALIARICPGGSLVLSGILEPQRDELLTSFYTCAAEQGCPLDLVHTRGRVVDRDAWLALVLRRNPSEP